MMPEDDGDEGNGGIVFILHSSSVAYTNND